MWMHHSSCNNYPPLGCTCKQTCFDINIGLHIFTLKASFLRCLHDHIDHGVQDCTKYKQTLLLSREGRKVTIQGDMVWETWYLFPPCTCTPSSPCILTNQSQCHLCVTANYRISNHTTRNLNIKPQIKTCRFTELA